MPHRASAYVCMWMGQVEQVSQIIVRRTTVESNMKVNIIYTWLVKTPHNVLSSFALSLVLFLPSWLLLYIDFIAFSFSVSPTVGCVEHPTPQNTYVAEDQACCRPRPPLRRSYLSRPPSSVHVTHEFLSVHVSANECKLTFLSVTDTYVRTLRE